MKHFLIVLALLGVAGCGTDGGGEGGDGDVIPPECEGSADCPGGVCDHGQCKYFGGGDTIPGDGAGLEDAGPGVDVKPLGDAIPGVDTPPAPDGPPDSPAPDILVDPVEHMFTYVPGVVNPATTTVIIYNQGTGSLSVNAIEWADGSSPEFTFMALPPLPTVVHPYEHTAVSVIFKEQAPHGPGELLIKSNDPDSPTTVVHFVSQAKTGDMPCIQLQPTTLSFGQVVRGDTKTMPFKVINCSSSTVLNITEVERSTAFFGMALTDEFQFSPAFPVPSMLGANQVLDWELSYSPGLAGVDNGYFLFHSNDPAQPTAKLNVAGVGVPPPMEEIGLHIEMDWDLDNSDVDLHLLQPGGSFFDCSDCYFSNPSPDWGVQGDVMDDPFLDYDDIDGYGPENINISEPAPGQYKVLLHYYNDTYDGFGGGSTDCTVRIFSYGQLLAEFGPQELDQTDRNWDVCTVDWPSATVTTLGDVYMVGSGDKGSCLPFF